MCEDYKIINKIKLELEKLRPKLISDGGDIQFLSFKNGVVKVKMLGECANCSVAHITLEHVIEETLKRKIKEVTKVININLHLLTKIK